MKSAQIPGTFRLEHIRAVVGAINDGVGSNALIGVKTGIKTRHVSFAVNAARILGWISGEIGALRTTASGRKLLEAEPGSRAEANHFKRGITASKEVKTLAPKLLTKSAPDYEALTEAISQATGLSETSAKRAARVLLSWRRQALLEQPPEEPQEQKARNKTSKPKPKKSSTTPPKSTPKSKPAPKTPQTSGVTQLSMLHVEGFGAFRSARVDLDNLTVFLGQAGLSRASLLDALRFLARAQHIGVAGALRQHSSFAALNSSADGPTLDLGIALEVALAPLAGPGGEHSHLRYELALTRDPGEPARPRGEALYLKPAARTKTNQLLTDPDEVPESWRQVFARDGAQKVWFRSELGKWRTTYALDPNRLALAEVPADVGKFPAATALKRFVFSGFSQLMIHTNTLVAPARAHGQSRLTGGDANLVRALAKLETERPEDFEKWLDWARKALPSLEDVTISRREDTAALSLDVVVEKDHVIPAARLSPATLRAMTLLALPFTIAPGELVHVDDPSLTVPPTTLAEIVNCWASHRSGGQIIVTTESPLWASMTPLKQLLLLREGARGSAELVKGARNKKVEAWRKAVDLAGLAF